MLNLFAESEENNKPKINEKDVEHDIIAPLLEKLGYKNIETKKQIKRALPLKQAPMSGTKRIEYIIPDFVLFVNDKPCWVLDAKASWESVQSPKNIGQVCSYAEHREIKVNYFAICNGKNFALYETVNTLVPIFNFKVEEILNNKDIWDEFSNYLSEKSFSAESNISLKNINNPKIITWKKLNTRENWFVFLCLILGNSLSIQIINYIWGSKLIYFVVAAFASSFSIVFTNNLSVKKRIIYNLLFSFFIMLSMPFLWGDFNQKNNDKNIIVTKKIENRKYISHNFYGNNGDEFLYFESGEVFYSSTFQPKTKMQIKSEKDNEIVVYFEHNLNLYYNIVFEKDYLICTASNGTQQKYLLTK